MRKIFAPRMQASMAILLALIFLPVTAVASDALQQIPENALGFVVVQNLAVSSEKFEQLMERIEVALPGPLTFVQAVVGLVTGLDESGDLVIALLPGNMPGDAVQPLVLLPVDNYKNFAALIHADASGSVCRISLQGEEILVAQSGAFAMLMNLEHQDTMEKLIARQPEPIAALPPFADWMAKQDVVVALLQPGIEYLNSRPRQSARHASIDDLLDEQRSIFSQLFPKGSGREITKWLHSHVEFVAIGIAVDDQLNVRLSKQLILKKDSLLAGLSPKAIPSPVAKLGLTDKPIVFTAGGPITEGWGRQLAKILRQSEETNKREYGLENVPAELWSKEEQAYRLLLEDVQSCSVVMLTGEKGEPLVGNFLGIAEVPDVSKYFDSLPRIIKVWKDLNLQSTNDMKSEFVFSRENVAGKQRCEIVVDIATTARDPNVPAFNWMLEAAFGPEGKMRMRFAEVDSKTFVFGFATEQQIADLLKRVLLLKRAQQKEIDTPRSTEMQVTRQLLDSTAPWKALVSLQGCLRWSSRAYEELFAPFDGGEITLPKMPHSPPVGLTADWNGRRMEFELVCPVATWETLGQYVKTIIP